MEKIQIFITLEELYAILDAFSVVEEKFKLTKVEHNIYEQLNKLYLSIIKDK